MDLQNSPLILVGIAGGGDGARTRRAHATCLLHSSTLATARIELTLMGSGSSDSTIAHSGHAAAGSLGHEALLAHAAWSGTHSSGGHATGTHRSHHGSSGRAHAIARRHTAVASIAGAHGSTASVTISCSTRLHGQWNASAGTRMHLLISVHLRLLLLHGITRVHSARSPHTGRRPLLGHVHLGVGIWGHSSLLLLLLLLGETGWRLLGISTIGHALHLGHRIHAAHLLLRRLLLEGIHAAAHAATSSDSRAHRHILHLVHGRHLNKKKVGEAIDKGTFLTSYMKFLGK